MGQARRRARLPPPLRQVAHKNAHQQPTSKSALGGRGILPAHVFREEVLREVEEVKGSYRSLRSLGKLRDKCSLQMMQFMGGQDAAPSQCNPAHPLAQTSDGKYHAVSSSPTAAPCPRRSQTAHQQPHIHAVPSRTKNLAQTSHGKYHAVSSSPTAAPCPKQSHQAAHQQPHTHAVHPAQKTGADL